MKNRALAKDLLHERGFMFYFVLNISIISFCWFVGYRKGRLKILLCDSLGSFMYSTNFIIQKSTMEHPDKCTVLKLADYKSSH